ncbi:MAG TPA: rhomboid family intramembrane serine protease [Verrucomicrobiae bacterium]
MHGTIGPCTLGIIALTILSSYLGFRNRKVEEDYIFEPERILALKEYYRIVTSGFLHADWAHLGLNMISLYLFGDSLERALGAAHFLLIYFGSIVGGSLLSLYVHRHHEYRAYGASGGVCGIIFAYILVFPGSRVGFFMIPVAVPGWLYAIGFMVGSFYAMKAGRGNVGHDAHLGGAILGLLITAALYPTAARNNVKVFAIVLGLATALLVFLWVNPLLLPGGAVFTRRPQRRTDRAELPDHRREELEIDAILEKVGRDGLESLNPQERALLENASRKYRHRADSEKPESGLTI